MKNERCFLIGIAPDTKWLYVVDCSSMEEYMTDGEHFRVLQKMVDGHIEYVAAPEELQGRCHCYVNEEGLLKSLSLNIGASLLLGQNIVGTLCIAKGDSPDTFFTKDEADRLAKEVADIIRKKIAGIPGIIVGDDTEGEIKV